MSSGAQRRPNIFQIYLRKLWLSWKPCAPTALYKLLSGRLESPTFPNVVNKLPSKDQLTCRSTLFYCHSAGSRYTRPWSIRHLKPVLGGQPICHLSHPAIWNIHCVCALDIELFSAIIRNTQVCVNILYSFTLYQGFLPSPGTLKCVWTSYFVVFYIKEFKSSVRVVLWPWTFFLKLDYKWFVGSTHRTPGIGSFCLWCYLHIDYLYVTTCKLSINCK